LEDEEIKEALDKLDIEDLPEHLEKFNITDQTLPKYNLYGTRSLLVYAAEEAVLSGYETIRPVHLFVSLFKVFPVLKSFPTLILLSTGFPRKEDFALKTYRGGGRYESFSDTFYFRRKSSPAYS